MVQSNRFHWTLIAGEIGDKFGYADRSCYATKDLAEKALREWNGEGEPQGWRRLGIHQDIDTASVRHNALQKIAPVQQRSQPLQFGA
jgi:hypothetical protein